MDDPTSLCFLEIKIIKYPFGNISKSPTLASEGYRGPSTLMEFASLRRMKKEMPVLQPHGGLSAGESLRPRRTPAEEAGEGGAVPFSVFVPNLRKVSPIPQDQGRRGGGGRKGKGEKKVGGKEEVVGRDPKSTSGGQ